MDYDFIGKHRNIFKEKLKSIYPMNDKEVFAAYDAALVETILKVSEDRAIKYDQSMEEMYKTLREKKS